MSAPPVHRYREQYHRCQPVHRLRSMCRCLPVVRDFDGPKVYPPQQPKDPAVVDALRRLMLNKAQAELIAAGLPDPLSVAVEKSCRLMAEDICREAGYMLPQSPNSKAFLESIRDYPGIPADVVESLLQSIQFYSEPKKNDCLKTAKSFSNLKRVV